MEQSNIPSKKIKKINKSKEIDLKMYLLPGKFKNVCFKHGKSKAELGLIGKQWWKKFLNLELHLLPGKYNKLLF